MEDSKEQEVIDTVLPEESQGFLIDYFLNGLFGESKMKDFTPLDLLRFQSQIKHFLINIISLKIHIDKFIIY